MAELKYHMKSPKTGHIYGPLSAGDRGNYAARGYQEVTEEEATQARQGQQQAPPAPTAVRPRPRADQPPAAPSTGEQAGA